MSLVRLFDTIVNFLLIIFLCALTAGCLQWTEDSDGNLQSVGLPGIPVWQVHDSGDEPVVSVPSKPLDPVAADLTDDGGKSGIWLVELNKWRATAGLTPVGENADLSVGCTDHSRYLVETGPSDPLAFAQYMASVGAAALAEDSGSQWYTSAGSQAAAGGKPVSGVARASDISFAATEFDDMTTWLVTPFHRFALLAPWAQIAGYGSSGYAPRRAATLAIRGRVSDAAPPGPLMFPPDGSSFPTGAMTQPEWPNPLASCGGYKTAVGLPISVQTGQPLRLKSAVVVDDVTGHRITSCAYDGMSYKNPDPVAQGFARNVLDFNGAAVVIPKQPLTAGHRYSIAIQTRDRNFSWTFAISSPPQPLTESASR